MLIEIAETHPPGVGKKVAHVVAKGGDKFEIWPEKLASLQVGARYDVDVAERDYNGRTIRKITKATAAPANGVAHHDGDGQVARRSNAPGESEFVARVLAALILKGEVANNKRQLFEATEMLRGLWGATFGSREGNGGQP
jgi:hypothetical protein